MNAFLTIQISDVNHEELQRLLAALHGGTATVRVTGGPEGAELAPPAASAPKGPVLAPAPEAPDAPASTTQTAPAATEPPKKPRGRPRKDETAKPADTAAAQQEAPAAEAPKITENAVKLAIKDAISAKGADAVRSTLMKSFTNAKGDPVMRLSDIQEKDYGAVVAALEAPAEA